jgi:CheY-specific phosphatase CheX
MKGLRLLSLTASVALLASSMMAESANAAPSISYNWQNLNFSTNWCVKRATVSMQAAGFSAESRRGLVVGSNGGYKGSIICATAKKTTLFVVSGADFNTAKGLTTQLKNNFNSLKSIATTLKTAGGNAPSIAYNWQGRKSSCINHGQNAMANAGFSTSKGRTMVVGSSSDAGYKGVVICLKGMTVFLVSGADFSRAKGFVEQIKTKFNTGATYKISSFQATNDKPSENLKAATPTASAAGAPAISYNWQNIKRNTSQCLSRATASMKAASFAATSRKGLVVGNNGNYKGTIVCMANKGVALFIVSGTDFGTAKGLSDKLKSHF